MKNKENVKKLLDINDILIKIHEDEYSKKDETIPSDEEKRFLNIWADLTRFTSEQVRKLF